MKDILNETYQWFETATPNPTTKNKSTQMGCHFEEVREMIQELTPRTPEAKAILEAANNALDNLQALLKRDDTAIDIYPGNRAAMLDALCDQIVTATGVAHHFKMDILGGMTETNNSNHSKFVDGQCIRDQNQKIAKGPNYFKADYSKFV